MELIDGKLVSNIIKDELKKKISFLNKKLSLVVFQVGNNDASNIYIRQKAKMAEYLNVNFIVKKYENISENDLIYEINKVNENKDIDGIIVQLPLPDYINKDKVLNTIKPEKDVDGLTLVNKNKLYSNEKCLIPCTPKGIIDLIKYYNIEVNNKNICVIGRSDLVGKPIANILKNMGANIFVVHSKTNDYINIINKCDIVVIAIGVAKYLNKNMIKKDSIIFDVGTNYVDNKLVGDVDYDSVKDYVKMITPVPGGIGPMTIVEIYSNLLEAYKINYE